MQTVYTSEQISQWVIDNRYPKSENDKVTDFEMYHEIVNRIDDKVQPSAKPTEAVLLSKEDADRGVNELTKIRNELYECVPTGEVKAFELISGISQHLKRLDAFIDSLNKTK